MGCFSSKPDILPDNDGNGKDFLDKYSVDKILGQGEFGVVKQIHIKNADGSDGPAFAVKILRKGIVFKDNTLYSAIKPKVLKLECKILKTLQGRHHNLRLVGVYESPSVIYIVSDLCSGGDMFQYVSDVYGESGLRTEDVSRISFQLFDAVSHCAKHGIMHRDIKPENIMFKDLQKGSPLRLIDFGSGTMSTDAEVQVESAPKPCKQADGDILSQFSTFAGSAFYISPEMFQRNYTCKTDVWSAGVTIYVLVAGYPSKDLQEAFNKVQNSKDPEHRIDQLKALPNMPDMPETFFEMLEHALCYKHKKRMDAKSLLDSEFIRFHVHHGAEEDTEDSRPAFMFNRTESSVVEGAAFKHIQMRKYRQYEREITTLIASVLQRNDLVRIMEKIDDVIAASPEDHMEEQQGSAFTNDSRLTPEQLERATNKKRLRIVLIYELNQIMEDLGFHEVRRMMGEQAHGINYTEYAYHVALLRQFVTFDKSTSGTTKPVSTAGMDNSMTKSMTRKLDQAMASHDKHHQTTQLAATNHSTGSDDEKEKSHYEHSSSVHGNNVWETIKKQFEKDSQQTSGMRRIQSATGLNKSIRM